MQTVVELPEFIRRSRQLLTEREVQNVVTYLARSPLAGDLIEGTGGIRESFAGPAKAWGSAAERV